MKKTYKSPVVLTVRINSISLLTVSNPTSTHGSVGNDELTGGYAGAPGYDDNFDEEEDW